MPYDQDLYYWSKQNITFNEFNGGIDFHHRFYGDGPTHNLSKQALDNLKKRRIQLDDTPRLEYPQCTVILSNGQQCPRRDMNGCVFHKSGIKKPELWENLQDSFSFGGVTKSGSQLDLLPAQKNPIQKRVLKRSKRLSLKSSDFVEKMNERDKKAFKWNQ